MKNDPPNKKLTDRHFLLNIPRLIDEIFCIYRSKTVNTCPKLVEDCKVGPQERLARAELRTEQRLWLCELPDSPDSSECALSSNESDEDDSEHGAFIDRATAYSNQGSQ